MNATALKVSRKKVVRVGVASALLLMCAGGWLWLRCSRSPDGLFYDKYLSPTTYWSFSNGKVKLTTPGSDREIGDRTIDTGGIYTNSARGWLMRSKEAGPEVIVKPSLFGIRMVCKEVPGPEWNRFLPRRGFAWLESVGALPAD
jgi:hypothetical protein